MQAGYYPDIPAPFGANMPSTPSTSRSSSPEPESPTDPQSIVDLLRSYTLPLEHAEQIADLLDASGISDMDYNADPRSHIVYPRPALRATRRAD